MNILDLKVVPDKKNLLSLKVIIKDCYENLSFNDGEELQKDIELLVLKHLPIEKKDIGDWDFHVAESGERIV